MDAEGGLAKEMGLRVRGVRCWERRGGTGKERRGEG